jgi:secretion/DNA translocation related CpaE-like protein
MTKPHALLVTRDETLLDDVLRLAAAAGVILDVAHDAVAALSGWAAAPLVLVGPDLLGQVAEAAPPRRDRAHVVSAGPLPEPLFRDALLVGAETVVELPAGETWLVERLTDVADGGLRRAVTIAVLGGSGGVGASTFAAALASVAAGASSPVTLVDADPLGGGVDRVVGFEGLDGIRWETLADSAGRFGSRSLREALPRRDGLAVLAWGAGSRSVLDPARVREVVSATQRGSDLVVLDLPRYPDATSADLLMRCDHVVLLSGLTVPAVAATSRVSALVAPVADRVHLVARGGAGALPAEDVAATLELPLLAVMSDQRRLAESVELGLGPVRSRRGPLARAARAVIGRLTAPGVAA